MAASIQSLSLPVLLLYLSFVATKEEGGGKKKIGRGREEKEDKEKKDKKDKKEKHK